MKTILVPMEGHDAMRAALETALLLARRCNSYIEGFSLRWQISEFAGVDMMGGLPLESYTQDSEEAAKKARQSFEAFMQNNEVPRSTKTTRSLSFGWLNNSPDGTSFVGSYGRVFDVVVMNRPDVNSTGVYYRAIEFWLVRERSANTSGSAVAASSGRHKRVDCMELQHGAGARHCLCDAASSESRPRYGPDRHWRDRGSRAFR